ncbi:diguanylate cyclase [Chitinispirillales bacterium ANBcel5]|uniref:GGDEF domain-containing protein n=1 Tax=Cellulosispirillum alkaliphilum TaxID=3039283 RepID=UPI002A55438B|nr:diguanylate cyclase [Chitinispirillales bacterium ANBcel5]
MDSKKEKIEGRMKNEEISSIEDTNLNIDAISNLKKLTDQRFIEIVSGDIVDHIQNDEYLLDSIGKKPGTYYKDLILALIQIHLPEEEAKSDWKEILKHKYTMSESLGRNVGIHVATLDYYTNIKKLLTTPKIVNVHEYMDTASRAITDDLTKAYNRHFFEDEFKKLFTQAKSTGKVFSVIMLDLDHFKLFNDLNGHIQGDIALIEVVRILHAVCSKDDTVCRYGGEEFSILLPSQSLNLALKTAENIRQALYDYRFVNEQVLPNGRLCASLGVTTYREDIATPQEMIEEADVALYRAKNSGRNRVKAFLGEQVI